MTRWIASWKWWILLLTLPAISYFSFMFLYLIGVFTWQALGIFSYLLWFLIGVAVLLLFSLRTVIQKKTASIEGLKVTSHWRIKRKAERTISPPALSKGYIYTPQDPTPQETNPHIARRRSD